MTRKELAIEIAKGQVKKLGLGVESVRRIAKGLLYGAGYAQPLNKTELIRWYNTLVEDGVIKA